MRVAIVHFYISYTFLGGFTYIFWLSEGFLDWVPFNHRPVSVLLSSPEVSVCEEETGGPSECGRSAETPSRIAGGTKFQ